MKLKPWYLLVFTVIWLVGCATTEQNIPLKESFWQQKKNAVAIMVTKPVTPKTQTIGAQGLLDVAASRAVMSDFNAHLRKTEVAWYHNLPRVFSAKLKEHQINTKLLPMAESNDKSKNIYLTNSHEKTVLLLQLNALGAVRRYYAFIPLDAPQMHCSLKGELIDTTSKEVLWRQDVDVILPISGQWDQPPNYPNASKTLQETIRMARQELIDSFFSGQY